ncbi:MAG: peptide chain release factor 3 [Sneathiellaceae bacterium]
MNGSLADAVSRRRTFAIISHPDAGKTTLTEKLLLHGGAIQLAGEVKARGDRRRARSDWMKVERERGISVASSVMTYTYGGCTFNLLDTPGHEDFSEDTYRTLTAVDSAVMVLDAAKGIEPQTRKLFEVCRLRDVPIATFINKLDRESQDPFNLLDEIEQTLALNVTPANWPIGMGRAFRGVLDLFDPALVLVDREDKGRAAGGGGLRIPVSGPEDPVLAEHLTGAELAELREQLEMVQGLCPAFDRAEYLAGALTPVFFGSALRNFGVLELLEGLSRVAPPPRAQSTTERTIVPDEDKVTAFVFKIQANMDPKHRDRIAFVRLCSGHFRRGMRLKHVRSGKPMVMHNPLLFLAQDRERAEEAWPGDIIGIPNHGNLHIGDALTDGEDLHFTGIPSFAPELLQRVRPDDPMKAKHLGRALTQLAEEGAARAFRTRLGSQWVVGVVGALQFDVLADRIRTEYEIPIRFEPVELLTARWLASPDPARLKAFVDGNSASIADDHAGDPVFMARNAWHLERAQTDWPELEFRATKEQLL